MYNNISKFLTTSDNVIVYESIVVLTQTFRYRLW